MDYMDFQTNVHTLLPYRDMTTYTTYKNTDKRATSINYVHKLMVEQSLYTVTVQCKGNKL